MQKKSISELISTIHLTQKRYIEQQTIKFGLPIKQFYLLKRLEKNNLTPATIADMLFADRPTITVIINNLKKKDLIKSEKNPNDKRSVIIKITEKGLNKLEESKQIKQTNINLLSCLNSDEKKILKTLLNKISHNLTEQINLKS